MNPADEMAAKTEQPQSAGVAAGSNDELDKQLRVSVEALLHPSPPPKPVEELDELISAISHHLGRETSERKAIYDRLLAIENEMKIRSSRGLVRYLVAVCIGVAATLAWQSYGETAKQIIATRVPELGWSPEAKQMIASWVQQLAWTKPPAGLENSTIQAAPIAQTVPETPAAPSLDPEHVHQIALDVAALRQNVEQLTAGQEQMAREMTRDMTRLESAVVDILVKIPELPTQRRGRR